MSNNKKKKGGPRPKYSDAFKRQVARAYLTGDKTRVQIANQFGLTNQWTVRDFVNWFKSQGDELPPLALSEGEKQDPEVLLKRIKELEKQLENSQLRSLGYETMIDIAENELGIEIQKKSDTKPSKP